MTKLDLTAAETKTAREALRAYEANLDNQLRTVKMTREGELDAISRRDAARSLLARLPAAKPRKPRKPSSG